MPDRPNPSPALAPTGAQTRLSRRMRFAILAGSVALAGLATSVVADQQGRHGFLGAQSVAQREANVARALVDVAGFRQRGNLLIGEVRAADGTPIRLVLDARTQALVGFRMLERRAIPPDGPTCSAEARETPPPPAR